MNNNYKDQLKFKQWLLPNNYLIIANNFCVNKINLLIINNYSWANQIKWRVLQSLLFTYSCYLVYLW